MDKKMFCFQCEQTVGCAGLQEMPVSVEKKGRYSQITG